MSPSGLIQAARIYLGDAAPANNALVIHNISYDSHADPELPHSVTVYYKKKRVSFASIIKHDINNSLRTLFLSCSLVLCSLCVCLLVRFLSLCALLPNQQQPREANKSHGGALLDMSYKFIMSDKIYYSGGDVGFGLGAPRLSHTRAKPNYCRPGFLRRAE